MKPRRSQVEPPQRPWSIVPYQTTHNTGGAVMGAIPKTSVRQPLPAVVGRAERVRDRGFGVFPQNAGYNPTGTVGALTYWAPDAIKKYLKSPDRWCSYEGTGCALLFATALGAVAARAEQDNTSTCSVARLLATIGDCIACHTAPGGKPFAGGFALQTPFGPIISPNLTPDDATGIGRWSKDNFARAMHEGRRPDGTTSIRRFHIPITRR